MITKVQLIKDLKCPAGPVEAHYPSLIQAMETYLIHTPDRVAAFLANALHETAGFNHFIERLSYRDPVRLCQFFRKFDLDKDRVIDPEEIEFAKRFVKSPVKLANYVYGGRFGNTDPGDGWKYRGRGIFQTTFKDNYAAVSKALGYDFVRDPDKLAEPPYAAKSAAYYWKTKGLNALADKGDLMGITRKINGGTNGHDHRLELYRIIREML